VGLAGSKQTIASAKASGYDGDLGLTLLRGPKGTVIYSEVLWAMEDGGVLMVECDGRHKGETRVDGEEWKGRDGCPWIFKRKR
jgi:hypothetical protein